jgi:hypothetical protein
VIAVEVLGFVLLVFSSITSSCVGVGGWTAIRDGARGEERRGSGAKERESRGERDS